MHKTIYFVRHAQSQQCVGTHSTLWPLSEKGEWQARELAKHLPKLGIKKIYSSPLKRCLQTIGPFNEAAKLDLEIHDDLREVLIHTVVEESVWIKSWQDFSFALPECETPADAQRRFVAAVSAIAEKTEHDTISISSHGFVIALFLHHLDPSYTRADAEKIYNPHLVRVYYRDGHFEWDRDFGLEAVAALSTHHSQTPVRR